jgi:hypothetical protein
MLSRLFTAVVPLSRNWVVIHQGPSRPPTAAYATM